MRTRAVVPLLVVASALLVALAGPAAAQTVVDEVARGLADDPVYVAPDAEGMDASEAEALRAAVRDADIGPVYVAVLPAEAADATGGDVLNLVVAVGERLQRPGTYLFVAGRELRGGATAGTPFEEGEVGAVLDAVTAENQGADPAVALTATLDRLEAVATGELTPAGEAPGPPVAPFVVGGLAAGGVALAVRSRRRRGAQEQERVAEVRTAALEDLAALDRAIRDLDIDTALERVGPEVKGDHVAALEAYAEASAGIDRARRVTDFQHVTERIEEGRFAVETARARLAGEPLPQRRPPCFFDPRHGPSATDVEWRPPGGSPRTVPVCQADAVRVAEGEEPATREITVGGTRRPYYDAPGYWGPWAGGHYGMGIGFFDGLFLGSILSGGWGGGFGGWGGGFGGWGGGGGFGGGGDFGGGGGGFGGGDFGGGFGGGDFGGGGGDF